MTASAEIIQVVIVTTICVVLIALRISYRLVCRCKVHSRCHRKAHIDDIWMAFSLLPLLGRALCIAWSYSAAAASRNEDLDLKTRQENLTLSLKLLTPGRIFYMFFLWCMKMCLLELYLRLCDGLEFFRRIGLAIRWALYITFVAVVLVTLLECRPLALAWNGDPAGTQCRKAKGNLFTMAICNIITDIALILFPISFLRSSGLELNRILRLSFLFALGSLVIITTIIRLPLIVRTDAQKTRSLWASIEIACACFIANAPFFQAVIIDAKTQGSHNNATVNSGVAAEEQMERMRTKSIARAKAEDDEIHLWHIEKMVSLHIDGGRSSHGENFERPLDSRSSRSS